MIKQLISLIVFFVFGFISRAESTSILHAVNEQHIQVAMRQIGHEILLASGDSISRVLPIEKAGNTYKISFESEFKFTPQELVTIVNKIVAKNKISKAFIIEVKTCVNDEVVYSFEKINLISQQVQCATRNQPLGCYLVYISLIDPLSITDGSNMRSEKNSSLLFYCIFIILIGGLVVLFFRKRNKKQEPLIDNTHLISIGAYHFDKRNMTLTLKTDTIELTSKETDLLYLLYSSANNVVERDSILQAVWGDEGDYVGRTLDVFISKLRKKLAADTNLKIVNVRGVGYKFVVN